MYLTSHRNIACGEQDAVGVSIILALVVAKPYWVDAILISTLRRLDIANMKPAHRSTYLYLDQNEWNLYSKKYMQLPRRLIQPC